MVCTLTYWSSQHEPVVCCKVAGSSEGLGCFAVVAVSGGLVLEHCLQALFHCLLTLLTEDTWEVGTKPSPAHKVASSVEI